jgi:PTS system nitrogen regulatory IIA component
MGLEPYIRPELTFLLDSAPSRDELFGRFVTSVGPLLPGLNAGLLMQRLMDRERQMSTSTPEGIAFPQAVGPEIQRTWLVAAKVNAGMDFGAVDHPRSSLIFCIFGSSRDPWQLVRLLARLNRICRTEAARARLRAADSAADLYQRLLHEDRHHG